MNRQMKKVIANSGTKLVSMNRYNVFSLKVTTRF